MGDREFAQLQGFSEDRRKRGWSPSVHGVLDVQETEVATHAADGIEEDLQIGEVVEAEMIVAIEDRSRLFEDLLVDPELEL